MTINNANTPYTEWEIEVAKRIACAVISYQVGVAYENLWDHMLIKEKRRERFGFPSQNRLETLFQIARNGLAD